jgi:GTP-binding protein
LRKRKKVRGNVEFYSLVRAQKAIKRSTLSILLIDAYEGVSTQDKKIASYIVNEKKGMIIAANKWDIAKEKGVKFQDFKKDFYYFFPHVLFSEVVQISAKTGYNKIKLLKNILTVYNNYNKKISTNDFNSFLQDYTLRNARIKYGFQKSTAPPVFELFVGKEKDCNTNFKRFLINSIRKNFDLKGVPFDVILRAGK